MIEKLTRNEFVPKFLSCSCHESPELNYILHAEEPRFLVEVGEKEDLDIKFLTDQGILFREVEVEDGVTDVLMVIDLYDKAFFDEWTDDLISDFMNEQLDLMVDWYIEEMSDLENY
jgi:hypothetical protein